VLIVGAGLSGVGAAAHLQDKCPWATFAIFEARDAIGGTWDLFRYPGVRSDSDMYTLGYSFKPWTGEQSIADGWSICEYIRAAAVERGIDHMIRFQHRIVSADWSTPDARWTVTVERTDTSEQFEVTCGFLLSCAGYYRYDRGYTPDFGGLDDFSGAVVHPQAWPESLEPSGKRVVIIGSGATAVTLAPALAERGAHVTMLQRSPSYLMSMGSRNSTARFISNLFGDRIGGAINRWTMALATQALYQFSRRRPARVKRMLRTGLEQQLPDGFDIDTHFTPRYNPWDQRLCLVPDGDFFAAVRAGTLDIVTDEIDTFTGDGIRCRSGTELPADIVVTATGLELLYAGGMDLSVDGEKIDAGKHLLYKGALLEGVPNFANIFGYTNASWTLKSDLTSRYICRLLNHLRTSGMRQCVPVRTDAAPTTPMLNLTSGYISRAVDRFPRSGTAFPWRMNQNYLLDYAALQLHRIDDDALRFS
jgi:monooxygenase